MLKEIIISIMEKIHVNNYTLDEEQTIIATSKAKYSMVVAGAGAGKTLTILGKIKWLLEHDLYKPEEFCCISFTNEAASSLKIKLQDICSFDIPTFTFHKLALQILKFGSQNFFISHSNLLSYVTDEFFLAHCHGNRFLQKIVYSYFGYVFKTEKNWQSIISSKELVAFKKLLISFLSLIRNNVSFDFRSFVLKNHKKYPILFLFYSVYLIYEAEKKANAALDFDDMIIEAINLLKRNNLCLPYKYIIIDEFQDTSEIRFSFVQEILKQTDASLCVIGDDFQSIYHFSGCDLYLFLNFQKFYPGTILFKIQNTYRNSQELVNVAGNFVQKNPYQISKVLKSTKSLAFPIRIVYFKNRNKALLSVLKMIDSNKSILILARNHFNIKRYSVVYKIDENNNIHFPDFPHYNIRYLTIHASKGLESDIVILLDVENDYFGIPSRVKQQDIINLIKKSDSYPDEEERRLFYVALTRAKETVYLLSPYKGASVFINEIKNEKHVEQIFIY